MDDQRLGEPDRVDLEVLAPLFAVDRTLRHLDAHLERHVLPDPETLTRRRVHGLVPEEAVQRRVSHTEEFHQR